MIEVQSDKFDAIADAIKEALTTCATVDGHKLVHATMKYSRSELDNAATLALMSLTNSYVRPHGMQFMVGFGTDKEKVF